MEIFATGFWGVLLLIVVWKFFTSIQIVPTRSAYIVERLGRYSRTLNAGFHTLIPFVDQVTYRLSLKEETINVPPQECFTGDEVKVDVDGVLYLSIVDPVNAAYGVTDYMEAATALAQTTTRAVIGKIDLDRTFEERELISSRVVEVLGEAGKSWGVHVHRYEISNLTPPPTVQGAMEQQVRAERERRAIVARSEGERQSRINRSEGAKAELINRSEGEKQRLINEAEGQAEEIKSIAQATARSILQMSKALSVEGGTHSARLQLATRWLSKLRELRPESKVVLPVDLMSTDNLLRSLKIPEPDRPAREE